MPTVSVVLATYNGEKYIERQLTSLVAQNRQPDEVLIFDDCSTDNTVSVINSFIDRNHCLNWKVLVNKENIGWRKNFRNGIVTAQGDIVFLCDQDDEWDKEKISDMTNVLEQNPQIEVLACNAEIVYEGSKQKHANSAFNNVGLGPLYKVNLCGKTFRPIRPGCTYAIRKRIIEEFDRLWEADCAHDAELWEVGLLRGATYILIRKYVKFYRHEGNNSPVVPRGCRSARIEAIQFRAGRAKAYLDNLEYITEKDRKWLTNYIDVVNKRVNFMETGHLNLMLLLLVKIRYYPKFASWCGDIYAFLRS